MTEAPRHHEAYSCLGVSAILARVLAFAVVSDIEECKKARMVVFAFLIARDSRRGEVMAQG